MINPQTGRDASGRFSKGCAGGPGRPAAVDLTAAVVKAAEANGEDLSQAALAVLQAMIEKAKGGDVAAARLSLDRLAGPVQAAPLVELQIGEGSEVQVGPPVPQDLEAYGKAVAKLAGEVLSGKAQRSFREDRNGRRISPCENPETEREPE